MKNKFIKLVIAAIFLVTVGCTSESNSKNKVAQKKETQTKKPAKSGTLAKPSDEKVNNLVNKPANKVANKSTNTSYLDLLAKELKLTAAQKNGIAKINNEFNGQKGKILKANKAKSLNKHQQVRLSKQRTSKLKKLLGSILFQKKLDFDKKYKP